MPREDQFVPHLIVNDGQAALKFYKDVFGAEEGDCMMAPDGRRLMHGEIVLDTIPPEARRELQCRLDVRRDDVDPGETASGELVDDGRRRDGRQAPTGARTTDAREARHGYSAGRPSSAPCSRL